MKTFDWQNNTDIISVVIPAYNEDAVLPEFHRRLAAVFDGVTTAEFIYVNDGSTDNTLTLLHQMRVVDDRICVVDLARNFGKEVAMTAGLDAAVGNAVIVIDADLQDPPELIPTLLATWQQGFDVVNAKREVREGESWLKRSTAWGFYALMRNVGEVALPTEVGDYRLLSRRAVDALLKLRERHRFMKGLFRWIGYNQTEVTYRRNTRYAGRSKWSYWRLWNLALEGITSFTTMPLRLATYVGVLTALAALSYGAFIVVDTLVHGNPVPGYPSLLVVILFLGAVQLITLGVMGEYVGRMFNESKQRPLYLVKDAYPSAVALQTVLTTTAGKDQSTGQL